MLKPFVIGVSLCIAAAHAGASAQLGGVIGTSFAAGYGSCNRSQAVPLNTPQDSFSMQLSADCDNGTAHAAGRLRADAATGSIGLQLSADGASVASAEVRLFDTWLFSVAPGTLPGTYAIPVSFHLEGSVQPGSYARLGGNFLNYAFSTRDLYAGLPTSSLAASGYVDATGSFLFDITSMVDFRYLGLDSALPMTAEVEIVLFAPQLETGALDFFNTATVSLALPSGWSAHTSSGLALPFGTAAAVPEPSAPALLLLGLAGMGLQRRAQRRADCVQRSA